MTKIKICGVTTISDAHEAAELGADAVGLNFFKDSPRYITAAKAAEIVCELPPFVEPVAVFVNEPIHQIKKTMAQLGLRTFQWHVGRSPDKDYSLNDFRKQFAQMAEMGGMGELMKMVPGMDDMIPEWEDADAATGRIEKMIDSMTDEERKEPGLIDTQARQRIATAAGIEPDEVKRFLNQFEQVRLLMRQMAEMSMWQKLKMITGMGKAGMFEKTTDHADSVLPISVRPLRVIRAFGIRDKHSLQFIAAYLEKCLEQGQSPAAILVDAHVPGSHGGTGQTLPWELLADFSPGVPLMLAGGLNPDNVARAIRLVRPYAVDVASGVESSPGKKDRDKMKRFIEEVKQCATDKSP